MTKSELKTRNTQAGTCARPVTTLPAPGGGQQLGSGIRMAQLPQLFV